jgi:two-component sensor histidine kinase
MSPNALDHELRNIGRRIASWHAQRKALFWTSVLIAALWAFALADLFLRFETWARVAAWSVLVALLVVELWRIRHALAVHRTPEAVAASMEKAFPDLNNQLINFVQFMRRRDRSVLEEAYVRKGGPAIGGLDTTELKDRDVHRRLAIALMAAVVLLAAPGLWSGSSWANSLLRVLNPFSSRAPMTLAIITEATPGDTRVLQGAPLVLACKARGRAEVDIHLELWPDDDRKQTITLGRIKETSVVQAFAYRLPRVTTSMDYRFRAGRYPHRKFRVVARPPLALETFTARITPPAYTGLSPRDFDALSEEVTVPDGAGIALAIAANFPLTAARVVLPGADAVAFMKDDRDTWRAAFELRNPRLLSLHATDSENFTMDTNLRLKRFPDKPPTVEVTMPTGKAILGPGQTPAIEAVVADDYGLATAYLQRLPPRATRGKKPETIATFEVGGIEQAIDWQSDQRLTAGDDPLRLRLVVVDNRPWGGQIGMSEPIVFEPMTVAGMAAKDEDAAHQASRSLEQMIEWQKANLARTRTLASALDSALPASWAELAARQKDIRRLAGGLLVDNRRPLGGLTDIVRRLYEGDMAKAIDVLLRIPDADTARKPSLVQRAIVHETKILHLLTHVDGGKEAAARRERISGLLALMDALVRGQTRTLKRTANAIKVDAVPQGLVDSQDDLASDLTEFVQACEREARKSMAVDADFSELVSKVAAEAGKRRVHADMIQAAEALDENRIQQAADIEKRVLANLRALQKMLNQWRFEEFEKDREALLDALEEFQDRMKKMADLQGKIAEAMRELDRQEDNMDKEQDQLEEELEEVRENMKEALLDIPVDLNIFQKLPVGNDLVEDVWQVFEEMEVDPVSTNGSGEVQEMATMKDDGLLDMMEMAAQRSDEMEMWLNQQDMTRRLMEDFDQAEFENQGEMGVMPMPAAMEDIIGELLEEAEDKAREADDSATNQGTPDMAPGWDIQEGEWSNFSAQGKSGNKAPDHKEQDGRSNIGRQGMSDGETTAASGAIEEGDKNIDKRMTQDPNQGGGKVEEANDVEAVATGGGKQASGKAKERGMPGQGPRRDSDINESGDWDMYMQRRANQLYAQASMLHVRTGSLDEAIDDMQRAADALNRRAPIHEIAELRRRVVDALRKTRTELSSGFSNRAESSNARAPALDDQLAGGSDDAPAIYRKKVSEYFKALNNLPL